MTHLSAMCILAFYLAYAAIYAGWLFHRSLDPLFVGYSLSYLAFLAVMATPFFLPYVIRTAAHKLDRRTLSFTAVTVLGSGFLAYMGASQFYYQTQRHPFDPYLQMAGARFDATDEQKPPGTIRIVTMGGSTTRSAHLPPEQRYPTQVERILQAENPDRRVEVMNAGMDWWSSKHSLINYVTYLRRFHPDIVIVMHALNDAMRSFSPPQFAIGEYDEQWSHYYGAAFQGAAPPSFEKKWLSALGSSWYPQRGSAVDRPLPSFVSLPAYRGQLAGLFHYLKSDGVRVLLVTEPSIYTDDMSTLTEPFVEMSQKYFRQRSAPLRFVYPDSRSMRRAMDAYNAAAMGVALQQNVRVVDAAAQIPRKPAYFVDDVHHTAEGARMLADLVARAITDAGWLDLD